MCITDNTRGSSTVKGVTNKLLVELWPQVEAMTHPKCALGILPGHLVRAPWKKQSIKKNERKCRKEQTGKGNKSTPFCVGTSIKRSGSSLANSILVRACAWFQIFSVIWVGSRVCVWVLVSRVWVDLPHHPSPDRPFPDHTSHPSGPPPVWAPTDQGPIPPSLPAFTADQHNSTVTLCPSPQLNHQLWPKSGWPKSSK